MKIILATDGSSNAEDAARFLSRIPHHSTIDLTVITTVFLPEAAASATSDAWLPAFTKEQQDTAKEHFDQIATMFAGADVRLSHKVAEGHVGHSIIAEANATDADLIVLGAKGHSAVNRILLGSVSDYVATQAECSVLVVRSSQANASEQVRVTIAHDNSPESDIALEQFSRFKWGSGVEGHMLCVVPIIRTFRQDLFPDMVFERAKLRDEAMVTIRQAAAKISEAAPNLHPKVIEAEHIGESIINFANLDGSNLIVMGEHARGALGRLIMGSTSRYVLRHADCSVWIARGKK